MSQKCAREDVGEDCDKKCTAGFPCKHFALGLRNSDHPPKKKNRSQSFNYVMIRGTQRAEMHGLRHGCGDECRSETYSGALFWIVLNTPSEVCNSSDYQQTQTDGYRSDQPQRGEFISASAHAMETQEVGRTRPTWSPRGQASHGRTRPKDLA